MQPRAKVCHYTEVEAQQFGDEAPGVSIRWVIDEEHDGAPTYVLRVIEVEPGAQTPHHRHPFEHENFIIEGEGRVEIEGRYHQLRPGDVVLVPPDASHQYVNTGKVPFKFLCGIPVARLRPQQ